MTRTHHTLLVLLFALACTPTSTPSTSPDPAPADASAADALLLGHRAHARAFHRVRAEIDAAGAMADCDALTPFDASHPGRAPAEALLADAWCRLRTHDASRALSSATLAAPRFEHASQWRRAIEASVLAALAAEALSKPDMNAWRARAQRLLLDSDEPLVGPAHDPLSGDLPYLAARASHVGLSLKTRRPIAPDTLPDRLDTDTLYGIASREYASFARPLARAHSERGRVLLSIDRGDLPGAARRLATLISEDARRADPNPLYADMTSWVRLARISGNTREADAIDEWLFTHAPGAATRRTRSWASFPGHTHELSRHLRSGPARDDLVARVRTVRRDSSSAIAPPSEMLDALSDLRNLDALTGDGWRLALEAGELFAERGRHREARRYLRRAVRSLEELRARMGALDSRARLTRAGRRAYLSMIHDLVGVDTAHRVQTDYALALAYASATKARGLSELLDGAAPPTPTRATPPITDTTSPDRLADHVLSRLEVLSTRPDTAHTPAPIAPIDPPALPSDTIALEYVVGERSGYVWVVHDGRFTARRISGQRTLGPLLDAFRETLVDETLDATAIAEHRRLSERLYVELIGPVDDLLVHADQLVIAPDGPLHHLPFEALARPNRKRHAVPDYLIARHSVSYIPPLAILPKLTARPQDTTPRGALVLGDPILEQAGIELWPLANALPQDGIFRVRDLFPDLPSVRREMRHAQRALSRRFGVPVTTRTGADASEASLRADDLTRYRVLHLGTHGLSDAPPWREGPDTLALTQPALLLSRDPDAPDDGILTLTELLGQPTNADLVVLSGCTTGRGWALLGDGSYGLAGAFLASGSRAVVASTWSVADHATGKLMGAMYRHLARGDSPAQALRRAQLGLIRSGRPFTPPFFWASFRLVGLAHTSAPTD